jgi:hypothetical protein
MEWEFMIKCKLKLVSGIFVTVFLLVNLVVAASAVSNMSTDQTESDIDTKPELPDFTPQIFKQLEEQDDNYILGKGEVPLITSDSGKRNWLNYLSTVKAGIREEMTAGYMRPNGSVMSYGYNYQGYLSVQFPEGTEVNESLINEIYSIFDQEAMKDNISDVPVLFEYSPEITVGESFSTVDYEIDDEPEIINESVNNTEPSHDIPGFTFFISLLAFLIASGKR